MFNRFSDHLKKAMNLTRSAAIGLNSDHVDTEHILLGLLDEGEGIAGGILASRAEEIRSELGRTQPGVPSWDLRELECTGPVPPW